MHSLPLAAEPVFFIGTLPITNAIIATWLTMAVLIVLGISIRRGLASRYGFGGSFSLLLESFVELIESILENTTARRLIPLLGTFFLFILSANWLGLVPGFGAILTGGHESVPILRGATTDLHTTLALAMISVVAIQGWGLQQAGLAYLQKYLNLSGPIFLKPINLFVGLLEIISELAKILSFAFRLFGNIFAGEVLLSIMLGLIPVLVPSLFYGLELFVGFIQAFVFVMLTTVFLKMAGEAHESH
ncbi:F0F1 ATP synthase subunit A [Candidatus Berkelbacteria bacterium]|nr:F0F1 ATP synthase subunit A [Candidatus Berkelbacteria bacterium]